MSDEKEPTKAIQNQTPVELRPNTIVSKVSPLPADEPQVGKPVDVNGTITPITRQPITQIDASDWDTMNVSQLHEHLVILEKRLMYAQQIGHYDMTTQISRGINQLRGLIHLKTPDELKLI